jgi:hypothetical protein
MKVLFSCFLSVLVISSAAFAESSQQKSLEAQNLLRAPFLVNAGNPVLMDRTGKTSDGSDCSIEVSGITPIDDPAHPVLLMNLKVAASDANPNGLELAFDLDNGSKPKILQNTSDLIAVRQADVHTRSVEHIFNFTGSDELSESLEDFEVKELVQLHLANGIVTSVDMKNDDAMVTCNLSK